jgi:hypothetical protein
MIAKVKSRGISRVVATAALVVGLGLGTLTACSGEGASAKCDGTTSCTVTFDRKADTAQIQILGQTIKLVSATDQSVTLSVNDKNVTVDKGDGVTVAGITVAVDQITADQIIVKATRS